jgi:hypothetical protein
MGGEIEEADPQERRRTRIVHYIGAALFVLVLLSALAGLLGKGPLSKQMAGAPGDPLHVEYLRFIRYQGPVEIKIHIGPEATTNGFVQLQLSRAFVEKVEIERIDPEPEWQSAGADAFTYGIRVATNEPAKVRVRFAADHFGSRHYTVGLLPGPTLSLRHFAFP